MIIAIDHGNRLMKGANFEPFISGLVESVVKPFGANVLKYSPRRRTLCGISLLNPVCPGRSFIQISVPANSA